MRRLPSIVLALTALVTATLAAQTPTPPTLAERLAQQRTQVVLADGALSGPGADLMREAAARAQFVMIGEDHGIAEVARFSAAFFAPLASAGARTLLTETGPETDAALNAALRSADPPAAIAAFSSRYPFSIAFYTWQDEVRFLERVAGAAGSGFALHGFDQELMGAAGLLLDRMAEVVRSPKAATAIAALRARERDAARRAAESGRPEALYLMSAARADLDELRGLLQTPGDDDARALLEAFTDSRAIYEENMSGSGFVSNARRSGLMKRTLHRLMAAEPGRRVLLKAGASHVYRGLNYLGNNDLGSWVAQYCDGRGTESLHVMVVAASGTQLRFAGVGRPDAVVPIEAIAPGSPMAGLLPLYKAAAAHGAEWSVFDLRPIRRYARTLAATDPGLQHLLYGFDMVVVIPRGTATSGR